VTSSGGSETRERHPIEIRGNAQPAKRSVTVDEDEGRRLPDTSGRPAPERSNVIKREKPASQSQKRSVLGILGLDLHLAREPVREDDIGRTIAEDEIGDRTSPLRVLLDDVLL
jgi:hypothetical protein